MKQRILECDLVYVAICMQLVLHKLGCSKMQKDCETDFL